MVYLVLSHGYDLTQSSFFPPCFLIRFTACIIIRLIRARFEPGLAVPERSGCEKGRILDRLFRTTPILRFFWQNTANYNLKKYLNRPFWLADLLFYRTGLLVCKRRAVLGVWNFSRNTPKKMPFTPGTSPSETSHLNRFPTPKMALIREKRALLFWDSFVSPLIRLSGAELELKMAANSTY